MGANHRYWETVTEATAGPGTVSERRKRHVGQGLKEGSHMALVRVFLHRTLPIAEPKILPGGTFEDVPPLGPP